DLHACEGVPDRGGSLERNRKAQPTLLKIEDWRLISPAVDGKSSVGPLSGLVDLSERLDRCYDFLPGLVSCLRSILCGREPHRNQKKSEGIFGGLDLGC